MQPLAACSDGSSDDGESTARECTCLRASTDYEDKKKQFEKFGKDHKIERQDDPAGNLYRGWAIGMHQTHRNDPTELLMTWLVIACQVLGPILMLIWAWQNFNDKSPVYIWQCSLPWQTRLRASLEIEDELRFSDEDLAKRCSVKWQGIWQKVLGLSMMMLLFLNGDNLLDRLGAQTFRLRRIYGNNLIRFWMLMDAFCNSWVVANSAVAAYALFAASSDIKDLMLDAFGLLFLATLDDYRSMLEFGIETSHFDAAINEYKQINPPYAFSDSPTDMLYEYMVNVEFLFAVARMVNMWWGYFSIFLYAMVEWVDIEDDETSFRRGGGAIWFFPGCNIVRYVSFAAIILHYVWKACFFFSRHYSGKKDRWGFIFVVLLRRSDPRSMLSEDSAPQNSCCESGLESPIVLRAGVGNQIQYIYRAPAV